MFPILQNASVKIWMHFTCVQTPTWNCKVLYMSDTRLSLYAESLINWYTDKKLILTDFFLSWCTCTCTLVLYKPVFFLSSSIKNVQQTCLSINYNLFSIRVFNCRVILVNEAIEETRTSDNWKYYTSSLLLINAGTNITHVYNYQTT